MKLVTLEELRSVFDQDVITGEVRSAFVGHSAGMYVAPPPGQLLFHKPVGDCHIKYGYARDGEIFVIKVATGFYGNANLGLPVNSGLVVVFSRATGSPVALLDDGGWLTSWRTAAAGALAASLASSRNPRVLGVLGAGHQAHLQAMWISRFMHVDEIRIWSRDALKAEGLAATLRESGMKAQARTTTAEVLDECRLLVTATPSSSPLFPASEVSAGTHIVALGADSPGKQELDPLLFRRAGRVFTDDHHQCLDHGDFGHAVRAGHVAEDVDESLGLALVDGIDLGFGADDISIVDLTGIPAQDIAIASALCALLGLVAPRRAPSS